MRWPVPLALFLVGLSAGAEPTARVTIAGFAVPGDAAEFTYFHMRDAITARAGGAIEVKLLARGEAGNEEQVLSALRRNRLQISGLSDSGLAASAPAFLVLRLPFLFDSFEEADFVIDNFVTELYQAELERVGLLFLGWMDVGWLNLYSRAGLRSLADVQGKPFRAMQSPVSQHFLTALGADVIYLPLYDTLGALQTGLVVGGESSTLLYARGGFPEEAPNLLRTRHGYSTAVMVANRSWFDSLSPEHQRVIRASYPDLTEQRRRTRAGVEAALALAAEHGVQVEELSVEEREQWRAVSAAATAASLAEAGPRAETIYQAILAGKQAFRVRPAQLH